MQNGIRACALGLIILMLTANVAPAGDYTVNSPDGKISFILNNPEDVQGKLIYSIQYAHETIINPSLIDVQLANRAGFTKEVKVINITGKKVNQIHQPLYGQRKTITDNYTQKIFNLTNQAKFNFQLIVRVYNNGAAFRYIIPAQDGVDSIIINEENTEFRIDPHAKAWFSVTAQGWITAKPISDLPKDCERPLVVELPENGPTIALGEAGLIDFARTKFDPLKDGKGVVTAIHSPARFSKSWRSPFRYILIADNPLQLLEHGYDVIWSLNDPIKIADVSFIKPGKALREMTLTNDGARRAIDFCKRHNIRYCHFDAGWYGKERSEESDATTATVSHDRGILDIEELCRYANDNGVGVIVYVNRRALERQLDELLPLYKKWGIAGIKFGFVNVGSQYWTKWLHEAVAKCAEYGLIVDVHDEYRLTGVERTWPNFMTCEGVRGDETRPPMWMAINSIFVRNLGGPMDHTFSYFSPYIDEKMGNHAGQLAKTITAYSPLQYIYWYDRTPKPGEAGGEKIIDENLPELKFWDDLPTTWDDTRILNGKINEYITIARRDGEKWYTGILSAGEKNRTIEIPLSFLDKGKSYTATIYCNDTTVQTIPSKVKIKQISVFAKESLIFNLQGDDGVAIQFAPEK